MYQGAWEDPYDTEELILPPSPEIQIMQTV